MIEILLIGGLVLVAALSVVDARAAPLEVILHAMALSRQRRELGAGGHITSAVVCGGGTQDSAC